MNGWVLMILVVMAIPVVLVLALIIGDVRHNRRVRADPGRTVTGIRDRIALERAATDRNGTPTVPAVQRSPSDEPRPTTPPARSRRPLEPPDLVVAQRVLDALHRLPTQPGKTPQWP